MIYFHIGYSISMGLQVKLMFDQLLHPLPSYERIKMDEMQQKWSMTVLCASAVGAQHRQSSSRDPAAVTLL